MSLRYAQIRSMDISNGVGVRTSIFFQGCTLHCKECFNYELWDFNGGKPLTSEVTQKIIDLTNKEYISGLSILGGEPLDQNLRELQMFIEDIVAGTNKPIWMWTGYKFESLTTEQKSLVYKYIDVLVDGKFDINKKSLSLPFMGSSNQRIIDIKRTLKTGEVTIWK